MQPIFERTITNRNEKAIIFEEQKYRKRCDNKDGSEIWICCKKTRGISMVIDKDIIKRYPKEHSHPKLTNTFEVRKILEDIYDESKSDFSKPITIIYRNHLKQHKKRLGTAKNIPVFDHIRSTAYRRRASVFPRIPKSLDEIVIPENLKTTEDGQPFVIFDNPSPDRTITLCSPQALYHLSKCSYWLADGTFRSAPQKFAQSYSIHGQMEWSIHPLVYIAMPDRTEALYQIAFECLFNYAEKNNLKLQPLTVMIDFEIAAANAFKNVFKTSKILYCHFHFCQSIWRHVQTMGLVKSFREENSKRQLANLFALPLIPLEHVYSLFEKIADEMLSFVPNSQKLIEYFEKTYLYGNRFQPHEWNHFALIGFTHRTNNALEGFHRSINAHNTPHPNIWKFILAKRDLDETTNISISQETNQNRSTKSQRKSYRDHDNRLLDAKTLLCAKTIDLTEYQRRIRALTYRYINSNEKNIDDEN